ncbi:putative baseplate assembly protein [Nonomuraea sp. B1E8]|uniref:putative baseplate assembly protein n=1 Tax=unclassified Nonomuraea TaxID=2593643 RepID=UPI00325DFC34
MTALLNREARRALVEGESALNGIDHVEVLAHRSGVRHGTLLVHLMRGPVPAGLDATWVRVLGGARVDPQVNPVRVLWAHPADALVAQAPPGVDAADKSLVKEAVPPADRARVLVVRTSSAGDWSRYLLTLTGPDGEGSPAGFDEPLSTCSFAFRVDCHEEIDCRTDDVCPPVPAVSPALDYLARDYVGLRDRLLDRLAVLLPGWTDRNPADPLVTLAELFAYAGDRLTYRQDAIAAEAHLATARLRPSVRRHARLLDYRMHEGCAARTWLAFHASAPADVPARAPVAAVDGPLPPGTGVESALDAGATVFETLLPVPLHPDRNRLDLHAWGDPDACLPVGATSCWLRHPAAMDPRLRAGDVLILAPIDESGAVAGDEGRRHAVRLVRDPIVRADPLAPAGTIVVELHWAAADALVIPLPVARRAADDSAAPAAVALANVALAEHAATLPPRMLLPSQAPADGRYEPRLPTGPHRLSWTDTVVDGHSATAALLPDPCRALPAVLLDDGARTWTPVPDLLTSGRLDAHVVAEPEDGGAVRLRYGDGINGRRPAPGTTVTAWPRIGGGAAGNVGADVLILPLPAPVHAVPAGVTVTNPLPAAGGVDPQPIDEVKQLAPHAFRTQLRAVTSADHAAAAEENPNVQRAVARRRWTGSWYAQEVTLDPVAHRAGDPALAAEVAATLDVRRLAGVDVELAPPVHVPLEIVLEVCVADGHLAGEVERRLRAELSTRALPDGRLGFFHPDRLTFGQSLYVSDLVAVIMAVPGVRYVEVDDSETTGLRFRRLGRPSAGEVARGRIEAATREVLRADSDPSNPEYGQVSFRLRGDA